jgi:hypothetical protein
MDGQLSENGHEIDYPFLFNGVKLREVKGDSTAETVGYYAEVALVHPTETVDDFGTLKASAGQSFGQDPTDSLHEAFRQAVRGIYPEADLSAFEAGAVFQQASENL